MFARKAFSRSLNRSGRLICHPPCQRLVGAIEQCRADKLTWTFSRCYAEDAKKSQLEALKDSKKETVKEEDSSRNFDYEKKQNNLLHGGDLTKYTVFEDEDSPIILDVEEERLAEQADAKTDSSRLRDFDGISLERGTHGVFDTEELVLVLKKQKANGIVVIKIPDSLGYADHMVIVTGKSSRHLLAVASYVRRLFKAKMDKNDRVPIIEGKKNKNETWLALDLGNIILHLFSKSTREEYDLESLWALGPEFDPHLNRSQDPLETIIQKHSHYLSDLQPADSSQK